MVYTMKQFCADFFFAAFLRLKNHESTYAIDFLDIAYRQQWEAICSRAERERQGIYHERGSRIYKYDKIKEYRIVFNGEIVFEIADAKHIEVNLGTEIRPTKIVNKGDVVALGRKAPKYRWMYEIKYNAENEYFESLDKMLNQLCEKKEYINQLTKIYEEVSINIYIRSEFAEIGYSVPNHTLKKLSLLDCQLNFEILSFGMASTATAM